MRVMVVGGAGYIGSALVPKLMEAGHTVTVVDLFWFGDFLPKDGRLMSVRMDAADLDAATLKGFDAVVFLAGLSNDPMADFSPLLNFQMNAALPAYLAYISRVAGVRKFIHAGSCSTYGRVDNMTTEVASQPRTFAPYGVSKYMAEVGVLQQARNPLSVVSFRMGTVCGASPRMRFDLVINAMVKDAMTTGKIMVHDPHAERPILDINDAVDCYMKALDMDGSRDAVNLLSYNTTIGGLAAIVQNAVANVGRQFPEIIVTGRKDNRSYTASQSYADHMGFETTRREADTVRSAIEGFLATEDPSAREHYNIMTFEHLRLGTARSTGSLPQVRPMGQS